MVTPLDRPPVAPASLARRARANQPSRLRAVFRRLVATVSSVSACAAGSAAALGCSSSDESAEGGAPTSADAGPDATLPGNSGNSDDAGPDATAIGTGSDDAGADTACGATFLDGADDGSGCDYFQALSCGAPPANEACYLYLPECAALCGVSVAYPCFVVGCEDDGGLPPPPWTLECTTGKTTCGDAGRRPAGLREAQDVAAGTDVVGAWLARVSRLEAASVIAFRRLATELQGFGAPRSLITRAKRSAQDEKRHARVTARLARARGGRPTRVRVAPARARAAREVAIENAVEGCVRESFAALVGTWQARHATDPALARAMAEIAKDETRHAALAWSVAAWLDAKLDDEGRAAVATAMRGALAGLRREARGASGALADAAGLPRGATAVALVDAFARTLFD